MLINKLRKAADFKAMEAEVPSEYLKKATENTPEYLLGIMAEVVRVLLSRVKLSEAEVEDFTGQIKERKMGELFTHFEEFDVPAMRIKLRAEMQDEVRNQVREEVKDEYIIIFINTLKDLGISKKDIEMQLMEKYLLTKEV